MRFRIPYIAVAVVLAGSSQICSPTVLQAAESSFKPSISVSEEATDNIFERADSKRSEFTTRVRPGAVFTYTSPLWSWDTAYTFEYRNYARNSKGNEYNHDAALKGTVTAVENLLFLDVSDTYKRVSLDVSRNAATESSLFLNQSDQNISSVSPYLRWRLRGDNTLKAGYRFVDTRYWNPTGIDKREHHGFADLSHEFTSRFSISTGYEFTRLDSLPSSFNKHDVNAGFKYEYADKSFLYGQIGNSWQRFDNGIDVSYLFWNAGITHDFHVFVATLETKVASAEDPLAVSTRETSYSGKLERTFERGLLGGGVSYSEFANTATDVTERRKFSINANGRYEILQDLTASVVATGERFSKKTDTDYPYRLTGTAGLSYAFKNELSLALSYTYVTNRRDLDSTAGANEINKAIIEIKKVF